MSVLLLVLSTLAAASDGIGDLSMKTTAEHLAKLSTDPLPFSLGEVVGIADLHGHAMQSDGFGGRVVYDPGTPAPGHCPMCVGRDHGLRFGTSGAVDEFPWLFHNSPTFLDLYRHCPAPATPTWRHWTHPQYTDKMLTEARGWTNRHRLSLLVASAMNDQILCAMSAGTPGVASDCSDRPNIEGELDRAWREWGGTGSGHAPVVTLTPGDAEHTIHAGKLAVVLGVEGTDYLDDPRHGGIAPDPVGEPQYSAETVARRLYDLGVTVVIAAHMWTNAVGGAALQNLGFVEAGYRLDQNDPLRDPLHFGGVFSRLARRAIPAPDPTRWPMPAVWKTVDGIKVLVNQQGLSPYGRDLVQELAQNRRFVLDVAHLSDRSIADLEGVVAAQPLRVKLGETVRIHEFTEQGA